MVSYEKCEKDFWNIKIVIKYFLVFYYGGFKIEETGTRGDSKNCGIPKKQYWESYKYLCILENGSCK